MQLDWLPPGLPPLAREGPTLCSRDYLTPAQGRAVLQAALRRFPDRAGWHAYADHLRHRVRQAVELDPPPDRGPLRPIERPPRRHAGYQVANVAFVSLPGHYLAGNLYEPWPPPAGARPVVLSLHGHSPITDPAPDGDTHGRFAPSLQRRCAALARMGAAVLSLDLLGYGDSILQVGAKAHRRPTTMTLQVWGAMRALDYLLARNATDPARVLVNGESGGALLALLLAALDPRVSALAAVAMISAHFFGACVCETGRPIHRGPDYFASNAILAALAAPRPLLVVSDGADWTAATADVEYPFLRTIYDREGAAANVTHRHLPDEGHDFGPAKRAALYAFASAALHLPPAPTEPERGIVVEPAATLRTFQGEADLPADAARDITAIEAAFTAARPARRPA